MHGTDAWSAVSELAASQHGVFSRSQAAATGLTNREIARLIRRGAIDEVHRGVLRFTGAPHSWRCRLSAATLAGRGAHASHRAAACLHGLDGFPEPQPVEISVARGRYPARNGTVVHRWTAPDFADYHPIDGIPVSGAALTLAQLGAVVHPNRVEQALDDALRRGYPLAWIQDTAERLHRPGPAGTGVLLRILRDPARQGATPDSVFERLTARVLAAAALPRPILQHPVRLPNGRVARIDLAWPATRWGIECHSRRYHFGAKKEAADHHRDHQLALAGWQISYLTWHQVRDAEYVIDLARTMLARP